jgi:hypothetical protein
MTRTAGVWRGALAPARPVAGSCANKSVQPPIPRIAANPTVELTEKRQTIRPPAWALAAQKRVQPNRARRSASNASTSGKNFQRDVAIQLRVASSVNLTDATGTNLGDDFIQAKTSACVRGTGSGWDYRRCGDFLDY